MRALSPQSVACARSAVNGIGLAVHQLEFRIMSEPTEQEVVERAYQIWDKPEGREAEFSQAAFRELRNEDKSNPLRTPHTL